VTETKTESELEMLAVERNSTHGQQLSQDEKKVYALKWWGVSADDKIKNILSVSDRTLSGWTKFKRDEQDAQLKKQIYDLWMQCEDQSNISELTGIPRRTVTDIIAKFGENGKLTESAKFRDFEQENSALRIYDIWNFSKATNEVRHFGNIPPEIIDNLMYYYTEPYDVVFDPFGGSGSTIDMCVKRQRRF
jgi:hypothetical protein